MQLSWLSEKLDSDFNPAIRRFRSIPFKGLQRELETISRHPVTFDEHLSMSRLQCDDAPGASLQSAVACTNSWGLRGSVTPVQRFAPHG